MTVERDEDGLRAAFRAAREHDAAWTPSYQRVRASRAAQRSPRRVWWLLVPAGLAAALLVTVVRPSANEPPAWLKVSAGQLRMPTDFLLHVAGTSNLNSIPSIGRADRWYPTISATEDN